MQQGKCNNRGFKYKRIGIPGCDGKSRYQVLVYKLFFQNCLAVHLNPTVHPYELALRVGIWAPVSHPSSILWTCPESWDLNLPWELGFEPIGAIVTLPVTSSTLVHTQSTTEHNSQDFGWQGRPHDCQVNYAETAGTLKGRSVQNILFVHFPISALLYTEDTTPPISVLVH